MAANNDQSNNLEARLNEHNQAWARLQQDTARLLQEHITLSHEVSQHPRLPQPESQTSRLPTRPSTCYAWAEATLLRPTLTNNHEEPKCNGAHHLFPFIVWRAEHNGDKTSPCVPEQCVWPATLCGKAHEQQGSEQWKLRNFINEMVDDMPYCAACNLHCKACLLPFSKVEDVRKHCEVDGECGAPEEVRRKYGMR